jgi:hypothetical protein
MEERAWQSREAHIMVARKQRKGNRRGQGKIEPPKDMTPVASLPPLGPTPYPHHLPVVLSQDDPVRGLIHRPEPSGLNRPGVDHRHTRCAFLIPWATLTPVRGPGQCVWRGVFRGVCIEWGAWVYACRGRGGNLLQGIG